MHLRLSLLSCKFHCSPSLENWLMFSTFDRLFYAFFIPYFYIQIYANFRGMPPGIANYLLAILNAMNVPSRILPGIVADRYGT